MGLERPAELTWYSPETNGDKRHLEAWCVTVGPPVIRLTPAGGSASVPDDSLMIVSWNTNGGAGDLLAFIEEELEIPCAPSGGAPGSHVVLLLQEAVRGSAEVPVSSSNGAIPPAVREKARSTPRLDVGTVAERCGLAVAYVPAARNGSEPKDGLREDKGNAILSTLPLSDITVIELPFEGARRVAVTAKVRGPSGNVVRVASVHLLSMAKPWRILTTGNASRLREASALIDALEKMEAEEAGDEAVSTIGGGDMNTWSTRETALRHLREFFRDSPDPLSEPTRGAFPTDHLMFRAANPAAGAADALEPASYRRLEETFNSDHHPIVAWLRFAP